MPDATQTTLIYERLRVAILDLDLAPGMRLTERWLESEFDASRTPVRAALLRLEGEGLAAREGRGWIVSPIDIDELDALAEYRQTVETGVVRLVVERATDEQFRALRSQVRAHSGEDGAADDARHSPGSDIDEIAPDFHRELAHLSGNPFFDSAMDGIMTRLARTRWLEVRVNPAGETAAHEHTEILNALLARDAVAAAALAVGHIRSTQARLSDSLAIGRKGLTARGVSIVGVSAAASTPAP